MIFYLGTDRPTWIGTLTVPLFISRRILYKRKTLPRAIGPYALDCGGFTELHQYGRWTIGPAAYAAEVKRYHAEIGPMDFAAAQDWMCEPFMIAKTGLSIAEHQRRTVDNYLELISLAPGLPWLPVLQGWNLPDYLRCLELYEQAGVDLRRLDRVGVGSICRRQATGEAVHILGALADHGLRLHGFGFKILGLSQAAAMLASSDSMAWSFDARRGTPLPGCSHRNCSHCSRYALRWRERVIEKIGRALTRPRQLGMAL